MKTEHLPEAEEEISGNFHSKIQASIKPEKPLSNINTETEGPALQTYVGKCLGKKFK